MRRDMKATHEIIRVVEPAFLVNSSKQACRYETADGLPLAPGYYLALWRPNIPARRYGPEVIYFGPFATEQEALMVQGCAVYLGVIAAPADTSLSGERKTGGFLTPAVRNAYVALRQAVQSDARLAGCLIRRQAHAITAGAPRGDVK